MSEKIASPVSKPLLFAMALIGLTAAWAWMHFSPPLVDKIQINSIALLATLYYALVYLPLALIVLGLGHVCGVRPLQVGPAIARWILFGLIVGVVGLGLSAMLTRLNGGMTLAAQPLKAGGGLLVLGAALTLFQVLVEELLFRGWLRLVLRAIFGARAAVVLAALAYALFTMAGNVFAILPFANLVLLGLFLGLLAERSGGIAAPA
ncbi:MAG: CPBP family glutamic-type intramembrane protease, partial [Novosphingobium sp.]